MALTDKINLEKVESEREHSIIYYLFQFMNKALFFILLNPNFFVLETTSHEYLNFFKNYIKVIRCARIYLRENIQNCSMIIDNDNQDEEDEEFKSKVSQGVYKAFESLKKFPEEFKEAILKCQNFLTVLLFSIGSPNILGKVDTFNEEIMNLLVEFVISLDVLHSVNETHNIINYKNFYNDGLSKNLNLKREFVIYLNNQKVLKQKEKEKEKLKRKKRKEKEKESKNAEKKNSNDKDKEDDKKETKESKEEDEKIEDKKSDDNIIIDKKEDKKNKEIEFTLLNYMWLFNPAAKNEIINLFNSYKRKKEFNNAIYNSGFNALFTFGRFVSAKEVFFILEIRRDKIIEDTLNEVSKPDVKLRNPLKVKFRGEQGVDEGGVRKEFFMLLTRQIFDANYGMFSYNSKTRLFWFNLYSFEPKIKYELIGVILGLAIFNGIILDIKFPMAIYKKLLGNKTGIEDLKECDPELYQNLSFLLSTQDKNLKEELDTNFTVTADRFGEKIVIPLKPNGENIMIDSNNKEEYVKLYLDWFFNKSIEEFYASFEKGFYKVFDRDLSKMLSAEELELIVCGTQLLDFNELKKAAHYEDGFTEESITIKYFWEILLDFNEEEKKKFLFFVTGCDRAPIDGLGSLTIFISKGGNNMEELPSAHTCFNNLILPDYQDKEKMKKKLMVAINNSEGFGLI